MKTYFSVIFQLAKPHRMASADAGIPFAYRITDKPAAGLGLENIHVYLVNGDGKEELSKGANATDTSGYWVSTDADGTVHIDFANLISAIANRESLTDDSKIVVDYQAKLDADKQSDITCGGSGNTNNVSLTYSSDPNNQNATETVTAKPTSHYSYRLKLRHVDEDTEESLPEAKFTIQATGADEGKADQYVQKDGTLGDSPYEFEADKNGEVNVEGLDAGTYTIRQTKSPDGYNNNLKDGFEFEVNPSYSGTSLRSLRNTKTPLSGHAIAGSPDGNTSDSHLTGTGSDSTDKDSGTILITTGSLRRGVVPTGVKNQKTGFPWMQILFCIAAGTVIVVLVKRSRKAKV